MKFASGLAAICVTVTIAPLESVEVLHTEKNAGVETNFCPLELFVNVMAIGLERVVSACVVNVVVLDGRIAVPNVRKCISFLQGKKLLELTGCSSRHGNRN